MVLTHIMVKFSECALRQKNNRFDWYLLV